MNKYCNVCMWLRFMFNISDYCGREKCTVFVMYHICHKLEHEAHKINVVSVFVSISAFCHQTQFYKLCYTTCLFDGSVRRDPGANSFIKTRWFCLGFIYLF